MLVSIHFEKRRAEAVDPDSECVADENKKQNWIIRSSLFAFS